MYHQYYARASVQTFHPLDSETYAWTLLVCLLFSALCLRVMAWQTQNSRHAASTHISFRPLEPSLSVSDEEHRRACVMLAETVAEYVSRTSRPFQHGLNAYGISWSGYSASHVPTACEICCMPIGDYTVTFGGCDHGALCCVNCAALLSQPTCPYCRLPLQIIFFQARRH